MTIKRILTVTAMSMLLASPAMAQSTISSDDQRDVNQQQRIEQGLQSGELNSHEAGRLEQGEARIDRVEAKDEKDGTMTSAEQARINAMQNKESQEIYNQKHDAQTGNASSASSQAMQKDVARDEEQDKRIENGVKSGSLSGSEAARLQNGEAKTSRMEARSAAYGGVNAREQARVQRQQNRDSRRIFNKKHNGKTAS